MIAGLGGARAECPVPITQRTWWPRGLRQVGVVVAVSAAVVAFAAYRVWQAFAGPPAIWNDSLDYPVSKVWAGSRPPLVPALLGFAGTATRFVVIEVVVAIAAWTLLALVVARLMPLRWRALAAVLVLAFGCTTAVVRWDRSILSESLAMSVLALLLAAVLAAGHGSLSWWNVVALVAAGALFASVKDAHVWMVWLLAIVVAIDTVVRSRGVKGVVAALGLALCAGAFLGGSMSAHRADEPIAHAYFVRVFPYPDRVQWFADHGMPDADQVNEYARATVTPRGEAPVVGIDSHDGLVQPLVRWLARDGERVYLQWLAQHPWIALTEPFVTPERAFNFAQGNIGMYSAPGRTELGPLDRLIFPPAVLMVAIAAFALTGGLRSDLRRQGWWWLLVAFGGIGVVHMLLAWHADGMETTRHAVVANAQARLCVVILAAAALAELSSPPARVSSAEPVGTLSHGFLRRHAGTRTKRDRREELARPEGPPRPGDLEGASVRSGSREWGD